MRRKRDGGAQDGTRAGPASSGTTRRDHGVTFVEILVSIVLLGTAVVGTLAGVRATIMATTQERDHAKAQQWLQSAVGVIEGTDFGDCSSPSDGETIRSYYETEINDPVTGAQVPFGFEGGTITVPVIPSVWDGSGFDDFANQTFCYDDQLLRQQLVTIEATSPDGETVEQVQVIKRDRPAP